MSIEKKNIILLITILFILDCNFSRAQTPELIQGFPKVIIGFDPIFYGASPIVCDFDRQDDNEILFLSNGQFGSTNIYILKSNGELFENWPKTIYSFSFPGHAAGDVNNDGFIDIVVRTKDTLFAFDRFANSLPGFPVYFKSDELPQITLYDLDNDERLEIITTGDNLICVFNYNGAIRIGWPRSFPGVTDKVYTPPPSISDLNGDNIPEIVVASSYCEDFQLCDSNQINIFEPDGSNFPNWPVPSDSNYGFFSQSATIFKDESKDSNFIIINSAYPYLPNLDSTGNRTSIFNSQGILINRFYTSTYFIESSSIALGNVDGESNYELSFGGEPRPVYLTSYNGNIFNNWPVQTNGYYYRAPLIGKLSITNMNIISFISTRDMTGRGFIYAFNPDGSQTSWSPLRPLGIPMAIMTICDLNKDTQTDLISISFGSSNNVDSTIVYAWTFPGVIYKRDHNPWPMFGHDRYRTFQHGFIPPDEPVGIQPISSVIPVKFNLHQNFPNPFNPTTSINFDVVSTEFYTLKIFDAIGKEIETLIKEKLQPGTYQLAFDGSDLPSGIYFYSLQSDSYKDTKKMILLK